MNINEKMTIILLINENNNSNVCVSMNVYCVWNIIIISDNDNIIVWTMNINEEIIIIMVYY